MNSNFGNKKSPSLHTHAPTKHLQDINGLESSYSRIDRCDTAQPSKMANYASNDRRETFPSYSRFSLNGMGGAPTEKYHLEREYHLGFGYFGVL
jgi:hypothetical protein